MRARVFTIAEMRKAGPFLGPRGGLWADPQHTIPWDSDQHGKITPRNCPVCRGLGHIVRRQTHAFGGPDEVTSGTCRTCNKGGKLAFDPAKARALGLPVPTPAKRSDEPAPQPRKPEQLSLLSYRAPPQQRPLFAPEEKSEPPPSRTAKKGQQILFRAENGDLVKNLPVKERMKLHGLDVCIENPKGSVRRWYDPEKKEHGETVMVHPYGFIRGTKGADGDDVDVFVGPHRDSKLVVIVNQRRVDDLRRFDEHKVMLGFRSAKEAREAYLRNYDAKGSKLMGTVRVWTIDRLKRWLAGGDTSEPAEKSL